MKIGIVNDMRLACEALKRVVGSAPGHQVIWTATDGEEAVALAIRDRPDLILMDLIMPRVDGVEATRRIMSQAPCAILVVTSSVTGNISKVYEAMSFGAQDAVDTPVLGAAGKLEGAAALMQKLGLFEKLLNKPASRPLASSKPDQPGALRPPSATIRIEARPRCPLVVIGVSTGGPKIVAQILGGLPRTFPGCVVVAQHIDANFAHGLANWLGPYCQLPVKFAGDGMEPVGGLVLVAQTHSHLVVTPHRKLAYTPEPRDYPFKPSIDSFFASVARNWPEPGVGVILTGMMQDGAQGMLSLKRAGWHTIAQSLATCSVPSMPKAAIELGAVAQVLPPQEIAGAIISKLNAKK